MNENSKKRGFLNLLIYLLVLVTLVFVVLAIFKPEEISNLFQSIYNPNNTGNTYIDQNKNNGKERIINNIKENNDVKNNNSEKSNTTSSQNTNSNTITNDSNKNNIINNEEKSTNNTNNNSKTTTSQNNSTITNNDKNIKDNLINNDTKINVGNDDKSNEKPIIDNNKIIVIDEQKGDCAQAIEEFYEDENYIYYFTCRKSQYVFVIVNGTKYNLVYALKQKIVTMEQLENNGYKFPKKPTNRVDR